MGWRVAGSVDVRTKILGMVLALTTVLGLAVTLQVRAVMTRIFAEELENRGVSVASDLASRSVDPILLNDTYALHQLLRETVTNHPDARYAFVLDADGQVLAHTFGEDGFPAGLLDPALDTAASTLHGAIRHWVYASNEGAIHEMVAPIMGGSAGVVRLGLTEARLQSVVNTVTGQMILTTLLVALAGIVAAMFLTWLLTRPILDLVATTREVGRGNLQARAPHWADDEIGALADAFNQMVEDLDASQRAVADKEQARTVLLKKLITAQEEERERIARDLHDLLGHTLSVVVLKSELAGKLIDRDSAAARKQILEVEQVARKALNEVREAVSGFRSSGLAAELAASRLALLDADVRLDYQVQPVKIDAAVEATLALCLSEAVTNVLRHAKASRVEVDFHDAGETLHLQISDDGRGGMDDASGNGLRGMRERLAAIGAGLAIESPRGGGSRLSICVDKAWQANAGVPA